MKYSRNVDNAFPVLSHSKLGTKRKKIIASGNIQCYVIAHGNLQCYVTFLYLTCTFKKTTEQCSYSMTFSNKM